MSCVDREKGHPVPVLPLLETLRRGSVLFVVVVVVVVVLGLIFASLNFEVDVL